MTPAKAGSEPGAETRVLREVLSVIRNPRGPLPVVTVSWPQSAAGAIATTDGRPLLLSGPESMILTHRLRAMHDAILVGIQTVLADNPLLSVKLPSDTSPPSTPHQPQPVVLDSRLRFPAGARLLAREDRKPWIFHSRGAQDDGDLVAGTLEGKGARLFRVSPGPGGLDLYLVLQSLAAEGISSLMVEGGARVLRAFITAGFADQLVVTVSPSAVRGLPGPGLPGLVKSLTEKIGADAVTWGTLNP